MLIGYARTSTLEQEAGLEAQFRDLQALGCEKVIKEQTSSVGPRRGLEEAMEFARSGDTLVVPLCLLCESLDVTHRTVSDRILAGASQALALHMKAIRLGPAGRSSPEAAKRCAKRRA